MPSSTAYEGSGTVAFWGLRGAELTDQKGCRQAIPERETVVAGHFRDTGESNRVATTDHCWQKYEEIAGEMVSSGHSWQLSVGS